MPDHLHTFPHAIDRMHTTDTTHHTSFEMVMMVIVMIFMCIFMGIDDILASGFEFIFREIVDDGLGIGPAHDQAA